ncbi:hypothetical protein PoHVEF18_009327 [Penicillium ochrochloron]
MLHHLVLLLLATIWPAFAFPRAALNRRVRTPEIHARETESNDNIPKMEGFNITLSPKKWQPILVKSFDRQATSTLTTTLTLSDHATAFTIKPTDTAVEAATFTTTSSGHALTYMCYPTLATAAGTTKTKCIKDTKTTLGVIDIGSVTVTPNPTGFAVGSQTLTPGGVATVGTHTLSLGPSGGLIIDGSSTHIDSPTTTTHHGGASSTPITTPTSKHTPTSKPPTSTHKTSTKTSSKPASSDPTTRTTKTTTASTRPSNTSTKPSTTSTKHTKTSTKHTHTSTKPNTPSTKPTPKPSHTDEILTIGSLTVTADPTGFQIGSTTLTPGGMITVGTQTVSLETGGGDVIIGGTTVPLTATTGTSSTQSWTTLSDDSTTGLYGIITLPGFETLTTPTIITTQYIESKTKTTTGPIYVGTGGIVLQSWPPSTNNDHSGGGIIIPDPIRPSISNPKLKCPAILKWLCGPDHTSSTDNGSDVNPDDKPNSNPKDDPNKDNNPTTEPTSTHTSTTSKKSTTTTSTCTKTQTVTDCDIKCSPTVMSGKSTTTTTCFTTSCSTVEGCSKTGTTSTTIITSEPCGTGTASACPTFTDGTGWVYPDTTIDTAAVNKLASSIMSDDDSILAAFSSAFSQTGVSTTPTTLATTTSKTPSSAVTRTTSHTASSTSMTTKTTKTSKTSKTSTKTGSSTATTTSALSCVHQYDSQSDQDNCYCEGHTGLYKTMSSTSGMTNYQPCAWTTLPPLYTDVNVGPITSTLSDGDVVYCTSAHWAENGGSSKYCLGTVSTISTASHKTTTTTSSSKTSTGVSATGTGSPTGEMYIGIITEGYTFTWDVYIPTVGTIPNWCDDSAGSMSASGDTTRYYYPPDIKFQDLDGKAKNYPCVYTGDKDTVGKLACEGMGEVPCTGDFPQSKDSPLCTNSVVYAGSAFPRVYCKWYGSDGDA